MTDHHFASEWRRMRAGRPISFLAGGALAALAAGPAMAQTCVPPSKPVPGYCLCLNPDGFISTGGETCSGVPSVWVQGPVTSVGIPPNAITAQNMPLCPAPAERIPGDCLCLTAEGGALSAVGEACYAHGGRKGIVYFEDTQTWGPAVIVNGSTVTAIGPSSLPVLTPEKKP